MTYKDYMVGNRLRGYLQFKARTDREAWKIGCKKFNKWLPSSHGRYVEIILKIPCNYIISENYNDTGNRNRNDEILRIIGNSQSKI